MNKLITLVVLVLLGTAVHSQNTIRVRPQHQKEHLYSFKDDERLGRNESNLMLHLKGADYSFMTTQGDVYYRHTRAGVKKLIGQRFIPMTFKNWRVKESGEKFLITHRHSGKEYGPINRPELYYDRKMDVDPSGRYASTKSDLFGFTYSERNPTTNSWERYIVRPGQKTKGPYQMIMLRQASKNEFIYSYIANGESFLVKNDKTYGPYSELDYIKYKVRSNGALIDKDLFAYREGVVWKIDEEMFKEFTFSEKPRVERTRNGFALKLKIIEKGNKYFVVLNEGNITEETYDFFSMLNKKGESLNFKAIDDSTRRDRIKYTVTFKDELVGEFYLRNKSIYLFQTNQSDYFGMPMIPVDSADSEDYINGFVYYSPTKGLTEVIQEVAGVQLYLLDDGYALYYRTADSLIYKDQLYSDVIAVDFNDYPKNWWMMRKDGDIAQPYKNGIRNNSFSTMPKYWDKFPTADKRFVIAKRDDEFFIRPKQSKNLLGPVEQYSQTVIADDQENYAECKRAGNTIWINGELISTGFYLVYNDQMNAFHWFSLLNEKEIYLHTYELN